MIDQGRVFDWASARLELLVQLRAAEENLYRGRVVLALGNVERALRAVPVALAGRVETHVASKKDALELRAVAGVAYALLGENDTPAQMRSMITAVCERIEPSRIPGL